jgi:hypothetical protein
MNETSDSVVKDPFVMLASLMQAINEAKRSGTTYRPEHRGFDFAIYEASIRPQIAELKNLSHFILITALSNSASIFWRTTATMKWSKNEKVTTPLFWVKPAEVHRRQISV